MKVVIRNTSCYLKIRSSRLYMQNENMSQLQRQTFQLKCFFLFQIVSVIRKPAMRTPRNMFILNLAVSDLLLCTVTMPLTLMEIITKYFPLGKNVFICKIVGPLQATSIFVSTISITAIALDRYQVWRNFFLRHFNQKSWVWLFMSLV